jgi:small GTP-binding protein
MDQELLNCKIVILGESGVGKTCIMNKFLGNEFSEEHLTTIAAEHHNKTVEINNKKIKITFWDTAGQEAFRAVAKMFYKGADIIILVYDITKNDSFKEIQNYWLEQVRENTLDLKGNNFYLFSFSSCNFWK